MAHNKQGDRLLSKDINGEVSDGKMQEEDETVAYDKDLNDKEGKGRIDINNTDALLSPSVARRGFFKRNFTKMGAGSMRGSVFSLTCSAIGSGVLTLPYVSVQNGIILGVLLIFMGGIGCWWSLYMLIQRARHHGLKNYSQITHKAGGPILTKVLQFSILFYMFATCLACTIVLTQLFVLVCQKFGLSQDITGTVNGKDDTRLTTPFKIIQCLAVTGCVIFPLALVVIFELPFYRKDYEYKDDARNNKIVWACPSFQFFNGAGIVFFAFTNQAQLLPIYSELANPIKRRAMKIISGSTIVVVFFYVMMTIFGYFSTLGETPEIIITRGNIPGFSPDYFQILAAIALMVVMTANCVTNYMPFRNNIYYMATGKQEVPQKWNIIITAGFFSVVATVSIVFPQVTQVLGIFGGITSVNICYLVPLICYIKLRHEGDPMTSIKNIAAVVYFVILCLLGWLSVVASTLIIFTPNLSIIQNCYPKTN